MRASTPSTDREPDDGPGGRSPAPESLPGVLTVGRVPGVPVGLHWSVLVVVAGLSWLLAVGVLPAAAPGSTPVTIWLAAGGAGVLFVATIAAHELAHVIVAHRFGVDVRRVVLWAIGGVSEMAREPRGPRALAVVALAGPLVSAVLGGGFLALAALGHAEGWPAILPAVLGWLGSANVLLAVFNLLPAAPLDGGRVLQGLLWGLTGDRERARRASAAAGRVLGLLLVLLGAMLLWRGEWSGLWVAGIGWFISGTAATEQAGGRVVAALAGRTAADVAHPPDFVAQAGWTVQTLAAELRARPCRDAALLVVGLDGDPIGLVTIRDLTRVGADRRATTRVREAGRPLPPQRVVAPDTPLERLVRPGPVPGTDLLGVVVDHGRVTGLVTTTSVARLVELEALGAQDRS
ncbi:site-2 protease family protein [Pseudonocardia sp. RS11V-5]|uniref:site-2 protease family protein n=1 Tax=Pseudonocardia terrae TaxID=2905831 RepID=UPI001E620E3E|nr:site-2 protease family protein [Pseudonocardia terrae]MCE3553132.1 site-2 protease family protein [Pseudonocardia terrae]